MTDDRIDVKVGATTGELKTGMDQSLSLVKDGVAGMTAPFNQMKAAVGGVTASLGNLGKIAIGIGTVLAGGALFKGAVDSFVQVNTEAKKLSTIMGLSMAEAGALAMTFKRVGLDGDTATSALIMMTRQLKNNEDGFNKMGIKTRDASGNLLPLNEIMFNSINRLKDFKEGTDRTEAAMTVFGRNVGNMPGFFKLTQQAVDETRQKMVALDSELSEASGAKTRAYKEGLADVGLVMTALKYKIGAEVIPVLIQLGDIFSKVGPVAVQILGSILRAFQKMVMEIAIFISNLKNAFFQVWEQMKIGGQTGAQVIAAAFTGNFTESFRNAAAAAAAGYAAIKKSSEDWRDKAVSDANEVRFAIMNAMPGVSVAGIVPDPGKAKPKTDKTGVGEPYHGTATGKGGAGQDQVQQWRQELEEMKVANDRFLESSLADDRKYWQEKLALCQEGSKEERAVQHEIYNLTKQLARQEYQERLADLKAQMADERKNSKEKIALQGEALKDASKNYGQDSVQYKNLLREKNAMLLQAETEARQLRIGALEHQHSLYKIDMDMAREELRFKKEMGALSEAQEGAHLKRLEILEFKHDRQTLVNQRNQFKESEKEFGENNKKIELLDKQHYANMAKLDQQYLLAQKNQWSQLFGAIGSGFSNMAQGIAAGTMSIGQGMQQMLASVSSAAVNMVVTMVAKWAEANIMMMALDAARSAGLITNAAYVAGAKTYSAYADIPWVGLAIAAAAAAVMIGATMAMKGNLKSSAGGQWRVPQESLYVLHPEETVLPAGAAESWRQLVARGLQPGAGAPASPEKLQVRQGITINLDGRNLLKQQQTLLFDLVNQGLKRGEINLKLAPSHR